jgi:protein tyrosine/serine phosphatase
VIYQAVISQVTDKLWRGPHPTWDMIKDIPDLRTVISLEEGKCSTSSIQVNEDGRPNSNMYNIDYFDFGMSEIWPPSHREMCLVMSKVVTSTKVGAVYVHCKEGKDRTGLVIAAYRIIRQYWTYEQARDEMYAFKFHWIYKLLGWQRVLRRL